MPLPHSEASQELGGTLDRRQCAEHADALESLRDLVGGVDVLFGRVTLLSGVRFVRRRSVRQPPDQELVRRHPGAGQVGVMSKTASE